MIRINIYNNSILASAKCGSRFLDSIWDDKISFFTNELSTYNNLSVQFIIVRNPYEHLKAALHTDFIHVLNNEWENVTEQDIISNYSSSNGYHYQTNLYQLIHEFWVNNNKTAKIIELKDLTQFVDSYNIEYNYDEKDYNWKPLFNIWKTKEEIIEYVKEKYPTEYSIIIDKTEQDMQYYLKLLQNA
jgi:hypothetical protein